MKWRQNLLLEYCDWSAAYTLSFLEGTRRLDCGIFDLDPVRFAGIDLELGRILPLGLVEEEVEQVVVVAFFAVADLMIW